MFKSSNRRESGGLVGEHSPSSEWGRNLRRRSPCRLQADREWADAKLKDKKEVRLSGQRRGDVVRDRNRVKYQEIRSKKSAGG